MALRRHSEDAIQRAVVAHLRTRRLPGVAYFHVPNGGRRSPAEASVFAGLGVRAGVPDLVLIRDGHAFALELKAPGGRVSPAQTEMQQELERAGATVATAFGLDAALEQLESWGLLRRASRVGGTELRQTAQVRWE